MKRSSRGLFVAIGAVWIAATLPTSACTNQRRGSGSQGKTPVVYESRGAELFAKHCAICHAVDGSGRGPGASLLSPRTPDFGTALFNLVTSTNGMPRDDDLAHTLRRGMPGSAMPAFDWLDASELDAVVDHVKVLGKRRMAQNFEADARKGGGKLDAVIARSMAEEAWQPGAAIELAEKPSDATSMLAKGRELYLRHCAACHGDDGRGRGPIRAWTRTMHAGFARDFTQGILRGPATFEALCARILCGMPRAGMPPTHFEDPSDTAALASYVSSLIPEGVSERLVQKTVQLRASRVAKVSDRADEEAWSGAGRARIVLAPLEWSEDAIVEADIAALHDGERVALRISWRDPSEDRSPIASDACAVQFSSDARPPLFGMGSHDKPTNMWHWRAFRLADIAGELDALDAPHARRDPLTGEPIEHDAPVYRTTPPLKESSRKADEVHAEGMGKLDIAFTGTPVRAAAQWTDGKWYVVLSRKLVGDEKREIRFVPGEAVQFGVAIWNGAERRSTSFKSVTIWHRLVLDR
ncbi:MAG: c-type cytochrome [Planctomycetes bacterium]|nr:c-type cytochrome [Planctomycetota bacterium]MCB9892592.1 c-type cytochrome [Planctomycetota bacterium]MCB9917863.1 c-type cytochrome [Planctomycetota bacterium]